MMNEPASIYIHIPFCEKRCSYCDFNTYAGINHLIPKYVDAILNEIKIYGEVLGEHSPIKTIFFGGGTPSLLKNYQFEGILNLLFKTFNCSEIQEISLEANPGTVDLNYLNDLRNIGFDRISFGVQSDKVKYLELMGRIHDHEGSVQAINFARKAGFENINIDLIYGLPDQTLKEWEQTLNAIFSMWPQHLSLYALGVEENTPLWTWIADGKVNSPDDDLAVSMYELAVEMLGSHGFYRYEISNFAKLDGDKDYRCVHNLQYWRNEPYIGIGAGAHGFINKYRTENVKTIPQYIKSLQQNHIGSNQFSPAIENMIAIDEFTEMQETMMVGLRLVDEGVSIPQFVKRFNKSPMDVFASEIEYLLENDLLKISRDKVITIPKNKIMVSNIVFQKFVN